MSHLLAAGTSPIRTSLSALRRSPKQWLSLWLLAAFGLTGPVFAAERMPAFPGALGFGKMATGWRGGQVVRVTNLADSGAGTLRACAEDRRRPRVCIFDVAGTIEVSRSIRVAPNTYIAGQTAPGEGIQIKLGTGQASPLLIADAHDVIVRFVKVRPGPSIEPSSSVDAVTIANSQAVYLDHLSLQFATDEVVSVYTDGRPTSDITIAYTVVAWGLDHANHPKGRHSKGALICSHGTLPASPCGRISLIRNLFAHNRDRNPDLNATDIGPIEVINNVFYDPKSQFAEIYNIIGDTRISYVGNVALVGPSTRRSRRPPAVEAFARNPDFILEIYAADNLYGRRSGCRKIRRLPAIGRKARGFLVDHPVRPLTHEPMPASETYEYVLKTVGAHLPDGRFLDRLDRLVTDNVRTCGGTVIDSVDVIGGWPDLQSVEENDDTDRDGMPDAWEEDHAGLDPYDAADAWLDRDDDGWSNLEEYLSVIAGDIKE